MSISTVIKSIQDIMRKDDGVDGDAQRLGQLSWLLFLKIFDAQEEDIEFEQSNYRSPIPEEYLWRNWAADKQGMTGEELLNFVNNSLLPDIKALQAPLTSNPRGFVVREGLSEAYNYMKSGTLLRQVINKLNNIDFASSEERHLFGDIYEELLKGLQSAGKAGEFYTPRPLTRFMTEMAAPVLGEKIFDPACGTGGFLADSIDLLRQQVTTSEDQNQLQKSIRGVEKKQLPHLLCTTNMMLHGIEVPIEVKRGNLLKRPLSAIDNSELVDIVLANPPFGGDEEDGVEKNFPSEFQTRETADLFVQYIVEILKNGGRAALVLPDGSLSGDGVKERIRKKLLEECNVHTIIRLPNSVFKPYASVATNLVFLTKGEQTQKVWFYQHTYPAGVKSYSKTKPIEHWEFDAIKEWWANRETGEYSWSVSMDEIIERGYDLDIKNPVRKTTALINSAEGYLEQLQDGLKEIGFEIEDIFSSLISVSNFKELTVGELCNVTKGKTAIKKAIDGNFPLVTTAEERLSNSTYQFEEEAVCIPLVSSTGHGHASINRIHFESGRFALGSILAAVIPKDTEVLMAKYLYYYLSNHKDSLIVPLMKGMANVSLSVTKIKTIPVALPSIETQVELIDLMEKCETLRETITKSKADADNMIVAALAEAFN